MFENLLELVKENAQDAIVNNSAISNEHNNEAIKEASSSIQQVLGGAVQNGNLQDVLSLFADKQNISRHQLVGNIVSQLSESLGTKIGIDASTASI